MNTLIMTYLKIHLIKFSFLFQVLLYYFLLSLLYSNYKEENYQIKKKIVNLVTILDFQIDGPTTIHEALIGLERENWKETLEFKYDETCQNFFFVVSLLVFMFYILIFTKLIIFNIIWKKTWSIKVKE